MLQGIYLVTGDSDYYWEHFLFCLDGAHRQKWAVESRENLAPPVVRENDGRLDVGTGGGGMLVVDKESGALCTQYKDSYEYHGDLCKGPSSEMYLRTREGTLFFSTDQFIRDKTGTLLGPGGGSASLPGRNPDERPGGSDRDITVEDGWVIIDDVKIPQHAHLGRWAPLSRS